MSSTTTTRVAPRGIVKGLLAGLAGFLVGEYGAGQLLLAFARSGNTTAVLTWAWLPWALAPLLCGVGVGLLAGLPGRHRWWYWPAVGAVVPVGAFVVTWAYFASKGVQTPGLVASSLIQVALSSGLALGLGALRERAEEVAR